MRKVEILNGVSMRKLTFRIKLWTGIVSSLSSLSSTRYLGFDSTYGTENDCVQNGNVPVVPTD